MVGALYFVRNKKFQMFFMNGSLFRSFLFCASKCWLKKAYFIRKKAWPAIIFRRSKIAFIWALLFWTFLIPDVLLLAFLISYEIRESYQHFSLTVWRSLARSKRRRRETKIEKKGFFLLGCDGDSMQAYSLYFQPALFLCIALRRYFLPIQ